MAINELIADFEEKRKVWETATEQYKTVKERLMSLISDDFARYLDERPEIPKEEFVLKFAEGNKSAALVARIILGRGQDSDKARNVTPKFRDFAVRYRPLEVEILRYFTPIEEMVTKRDSFYAHPNTYQKIDADKC